MPPSGTSGGAAPCAFTTTLGSVGERWTFLVLREALAGTTRFSEFRQALGIASDVLTCRLTTLVDAGILVRQSYREPGQRARSSYHLTPSGRDLGVSVAALQQWGDDHVASPVVPTVAYRTADGLPVSVQFIDEQGVVHPPDEVQLERTASHPLHQTR